MPNENVNSVCFDILRVGTSWIRESRRAAKWNN